MSRAFHKAKDYAMIENDDDLPAAPVERRKSERTSDDADWESKVLGRIGNRVRDLTSQQPEGTSFGWESAALDALRRRIEQGWG